MDFSERIVQAVQNANARIGRRVEASEALRRQWEGRRDQIRTVLREAEHALTGQGFPAHHEDNGDSVSLRIERRGVEHTLVFRPTDQAHEGRLLVAVEAGLEGRIDELLLPDREVVEAKVVEFVEAVAAP